MKTIELISGNKGGVGKSWFSSVRVHLAAERGEKVHIIETDTGNPDVLAAYLTCQHERVSGTAISLDSQNGWIGLLDAIENQTEDTRIIVNHGARGNFGVSENGSLFFENLQELGANLQVFWLLNAELDGLKSLKEFIENTGKSDVCCALNTHFGSASDFDLYKKSKIRAAVQNAGGKETFFPALAERVARAMRVNNLTFSALDSLPLSNRLAARDFLKRCEAAFETAGV